MNWTNALTGLKGGFLFRFHSLRVVTVFGWNTPHIVLVLGRVECMWEVPLLELLIFNVEGVRKGRKREGEKTEAVLERDGARFKCQDFGTRAGLIDRASAVLLELVQNKHPVEALQIMERGLGLRISQFITLNSV